MRSQSTMTFKERYNLLESIGIEKPTKDMVWRVDDALELAKGGYVTLIRDDHCGKHYDVRSQSNPNQVYHVMFDGYPSTYCTCPDWHKHDSEDADEGIPFSLWVCKHGIAARLFDHYQQMQNNDFDYDEALAELNTLEAERNQIVDQLDALKRKADTLCSAISHIKRNMLAHMETTNQRQVETKTHKLWLAKLPMRVVVKTLDDVSDDFKQTKTEVVADKGEIARHVKATGEIPNGVELLQKSYVRIQEVKS